MSPLLALLLCALLAGPAPTPPPTLELRDGRTFQLKAPPRTEGGRVIFTTVEGKSYSLDEREVKSFVSAPPTPTPPPLTHNPQDSRELGAIARQQRAETGKTTDLSASTPTPRPTRRATPRPTKTRPKTSPTVPAHRTPARPAKNPTPAPR